MEGLFIEMRPGVLENAGRAHRVELLLVDRERVGHLRQVDGRWRWVVYPDTTGEENTQRMAARMAQYFWSQRWAEQQRSPLRAEAREVGPSSRRPGSGPQVGVVHVRGDGLTHAERSDRAAAATAICLARGEERERLTREYAARWSP